MTESDVYLWTFLFENEYKKRCILQYPSFCADENDLITEAEYVFKGKVLEIKSKISLYMKEDNDDDNPILHLWTYIDKGKKCMELNMKDVEITSCRPGNQIRLVHIPTGIVVECDEHQSQHMNRDDAIAKLKEKLMELKHD